MLIVMLVVSDIIIYLLKASDLHSDDEPPGNEFIPWDEDDTPGNQLVQ